MSSFSYLSAEDANAIVPSSCKTLCLFATYQPREEDFVCEDNVKYASSLAAAFDTVVLLTNVRDQNITRHESLPHNVVIVPLENLCFDFGMWFRFLYHFDTSLLTRLGLVNDSCILLRAKDLEEVIQKTNAPFWGMTDSHECNVHHLQSYFLMFEGGGIQQLKKFIKESDIASYVDKTKSHIVGGFELGLSQYMSKHMPLHAVYPYTNLFHIPSKWGTFAHNPAHGMWDRLLIDGMPILKKGRMHFEDEERFIATFTK